MRRGAIHHIDANSFGKSCGFSQARVNTTGTALALIRIHNHRPRPAAQAFFTLKFETAQSANLVRIIRAFFGKIQGVCGLNRRHSMLVNELHHAIALQKHAEQVVGCDFPL